MSTIPTKLETLEDFEETCKTFLKPLLENRAKIIAQTIKKLHDKMASGKVDEEEILLCMNEIEEATSFASEENPISPYLKNIVALEQKLIAQGLLNYEEEY